MQKISERIDFGPESAILRVIPDKGAVPDFKPGQFAVLGLPGSTPRCEGAEAEKNPPKDPTKLIRRAYSIASSPLNKNYLEFYLVLVRYGALTPRLWTLKTGDSIWLGPKMSGTFTMDDVPEDKNVVFIGTGTGLAPYVSMLYTFFKPNQKRKFAIFHGARVSQDLAYRSELDNMQRFSPQFSYLPIISRPHLDPIPWNKITGHVQKIWEAKEVEKKWGFKPTPKDTHIFLCGSPQMIDDMITMLGKEGFKEHTKKEPGQIHVERYW